MIEDYEDDDEEVGDGTEEEEEEWKPGVAFKTPSSRTPSSRFRPLGPLSASKTPSKEFISPSLLHEVNRCVRSRVMNKNFNPSLTYHYGES